MRKTAIILALTTLISTYSQPSYAENLEELLSGQKLPLTVQLKNLDNSWRQITINGQFEMGDLLQTYSSLFGGSTNNIYYTQGQMVKIGSETYIIAYRLPSKGEAVSFSSIFQSVLGGTAQPAPDNKLTLETPLTLSLLNLRTIGSLNNVRSFNLDETIAASEKAYQESLAAYEKTHLESINTEVNSHLQSLTSALITYATDNNGVLPKMDNVNTVESILADRVDSSYYLHPETAEPYQINFSLSGKNLADIPNPEETIVFYEAKPASDGTRGVSFLDGSVQRIADADWSTVKQKSKLP